MWRKLTCKMLSRAFSERGGSASILSISKRMRSMVASLQVGLHVIFSLKVLQLEASFEREIFDTCMLPRGFSIPQHLPQCLVFKFGSRKESNVESPGTMSACQAYLYQVELSSWSLYTTSTSPDDTDFK